jgi:hypothetical protein
MATDVQTLLGGMDAEGRMRPRKQPEAIVWGEKDAKGHVGWKTLRHWATGRVRERPRIGELEEV